METEMIDKLYLELSQVSKATTGKELDLMREVNRLKKGLEDVHDRVSGKRGNPKWIEGHLENLLAGRYHDEWGDNRF